MSVGALIIGLGSVSFPMNTSPKPQVKSFKYVGDISPTGFFDPLKLSNSENSKYLREAELQHGRLAMAATTFIPLYEYFNKDSLGINFLSDMDFNQQLPFWYIMALLEFGRMKTGWVNPFTNKSTFKLKDDFQPGNYLNFDSATVNDRKYNSELSNGRLAMLAAMHIIGSELLTGNSVV